MSAIDIQRLRADFPIPTVAGAVVPLKKAGAEWKGCCPFHADRSPSFTVFDGGQRFMCFGCGATGDVLDFVSRYYRLGLRESAMKLAGNILPTVEVVPQSCSREQFSDDRTNEARAIWRGSKPAPGTLAEAYLRSRGINIAIPESIRFTSLCYGKRGREYPCLVAVVAGPDSKFWGIQRTYLADDGSGKANLPKPKLSLGKVSGGAIRLAPVSGNLVVTEGLEDGLTLQQTMGAAAWVAAGASMLPKMRFPDLVTSVAIGGDNDAPGRSAADKAAQAFRKVGLQARTFFPLEANDFNAELMEMAQ